ncbi:MAG TPA: DNA translocase FtsK 4TM domain-containing protein, partial [Chitinophagaceae bacterium]
MAGNKLKSPNKAKPKKESPDTLKKDKEPEVKVRELVKDERTHKVVGTICLLLALYLFIAFASYLFTWQDDQDKVFSLSYKILFNNDVQVENLLGRLGAFVSHLFFYKGFGIASYLFCYFFFILGVNAIVGRRVFRIWRNTRYIIFGLLFISTALSFAFSSALAFPWGGAFGNMAATYLSGFLGSTGTILLLGVAALAFLIWKFNFDFKLPKSPSRPAAAVAGPETEEQHPQEVVPMPLGNGNALKGNPGLTILQPRTINDTFSEDIRLVEKDLPAENIPVMPPAAPSLPPPDILEGEGGGEEGMDKRVKKNRQGEEMELEINPAREEETAKE